MGLSKLLFMSVREHEAQLTDYQLELINKIKEDEQLREIKPAVQKVRTDKR